MRDFLKGGGEMGALTRALDWSKTSLGSPDEWPLSLCTTVATLLSSRFPMFLWWGEDLIQFYNDAYRPSLGNDGKHPGALGQKAKDTWPEIWDIIYPLIRQVLDTGEATWSEDQLIPIYRNGKIEDVYWTFGYSPVPDDAFRIAGVLVVCMETTQKVLAKKQVEENEKNFRNVILKAPIAICILRGPNHLVEIANEHMLQLWGVTSAKVLHKPLFEGLPEVKSQGFEKLLAGVYHTGEGFSAQNVEVALPRNGKIEQEYVDFLYEAETGAGGFITGIIVVAVLVTAQVKARRQIEEVVADRTKELAQANLHLQRSNAELSRFAYIASHDLQEPARKIATFSQMLQNSAPELDEKSRNYLAKINKAGGRMMTLIRDVLSYSELSKQAPAFESVDLGVVIQDVKTELELLIEQKGADIGVDGLPILEAIPLQMFQLFGNLLSNALKYSRQAVPPVIRISAQSEGGYCHIQVSDNGIGFEQEYAEQIFSIFQRLHRKTEYTGTGIGLAMCKKIAENHHGDIYASGVPGRGATFHIILPEKQENAG
jgi:signal transduction histidine kinase